MDKHSWLPVGWLLFACLFSNTSLLLPLYVELWRAATCAHITTDLSLFHACWAIICLFVELTLLLWVSGPLWSGAIQEVDWCTVHQRGINWLLIWWKGRARCSVGARVFFAVNHVACFRCPGKQLGYRKKELIKRNLTLPPAPPSIPRRLDWSIPQTDRDGHCTWTLVSHSNTQEAKSRDSHQPRLLSPWFRWVAITCLKAASRTPGLGLCLWSGAEVSDTSSHQSYLKSVPKL